MEYGVIDFFKVMSTVLHAQLVNILLTIICILYAYFVSPTGFYSVYRRICFYRFLSKPTQHFLFKSIQQLVFIGFRPNYSPTSIHTQTQTCLS